MRPTIWQAAALLYLVLPVTLFLAFFSSYLMATAGICFVVWASFQFMRGGLERSVTWPVASALMLLACLTAGSAGILPPLWQNGDYAKHYGILHLLMEQHWPVVIDVGQGPEMLRYYLGWYLVPAGLSKALGHRSLDYILAAWTALGLWLVFLLLAEALKTKSKWWSVLAAILFMLFSGLDQLGVGLTKHLLGYADHFEWWAIFYQYSSMMTDLVWVPQHGLPAWLAVGLLLNAVPGSRIITHAGLICLAVFFWSPLCAAGLLPFVLVAGRARMFRGFLSLSNVLSVLALAPPLLGYLLASTAQLPHSWIFLAPRWTVQNLICFWLFEFGMFALLIAAVGTERKAFFGVAVGALLLIPLFSLGAMNDFAMRVSTAPIAVLAFVGIEVMLSKPWRQTLPLSIVFLLGVGTPLIEITRSFRWSGREGGRVEPLYVMRMDPSNEFRAQYLAPYPNRFVRPVASVARISYPPPLPEPAPAPPRRRKRARPQ